MRRSYRSLVLAIGVIGAASVFLVLVLLPERDLRVTGFRQSTSEIEVTFNRAPKEVEVVKARRVPIQLKGLPSDGIAIPVDVSGTTITIPFKAAPEPVATEYSIIVSTSDGWLELVRQSSGWLKTQLDFDKRGGYTILGRRSIRVSGAGVNPLPAHAFVGAPTVPDISPKGDSEFEEVALAVGLLEFIASQPITQGPTVLRYSEFLKRPFREKLELVRDGKFAVMCSAFRDLFLHASEGVPGLKVRAVEAFNYAPPLPGLIPYSHSTTEVWVERLAQWVLFDPWLGIMVEHDGMPVGASYLNGAEGTDGLSLVPVIDHIPRVYRTSGGEVVSYEYRPEITSLDGFVCVELGCSPGYLEYFRHFVVRDHDVVPAP
jgi:hypothetical protein